MGKNHFIYYLVFHIWHPEMGLWIVSLEWDIVSILPH